MTPEEVMLQTGLRGGLTAVIVLLGVRVFALWRRPGAAVGVLAVGGAYIAGYLLRLGLPDVENWEAVDCAGWLAAGAAVLVLIAVGMGVAGRAVGTPGIWQVIVFAAFVVMCLRPMWQNTWERWESAGWIGGFVAGFAGLWWLVRRWLRTVGEQLTGVCLLPLGLSASVLPMLTGYQTLGELAVYPAAAWVGVLIAAWWTGRPSIAAGAAQAGVFVAAGIWLSGWAFAETPIWTVVALGLTPVVGLLVRVPWVGRDGVIRKGGVLAAAVCLAVAAVFVPVVLRFMREAAETGYDF